MAVNSEAAIYYGKRVGAFLWDVLILIAVTLYTYGERVTRLFVPRPLKSLKGEIILLTGSGNGIGKEIAFELANVGATLICWDNEGEANDRTVAELKKLGTKVFGYTVDISERENIVKAAEQVRADVGDVTIVINNAGIAPNGPFLEVKEELLEKVYKVNTLSHMWILRQFLPKMIEKNHGHVITTASLSSFVPCKEIAAYAASKHAVHGFIDSLRQEMNDHPKKPNIKFTTVYPWFVNTRLVDGVTIISKHGAPVPYVSAEYIAKKTVEGFRQDYEHLFLPPSAQFLAFLTALAPHRVTEALQRGVLGNSVTRENPVRNGHAHKKSN